MTVNVTGSIIKDMCDNKKKNTVWVWEALFPYIIYLIVMEFVTAIVPYITGRTDGNSVTAGLAGQIIMIPVLIFMLHKECMLKFVFEWKKDAVRDLIIPFAAGTIIGAAATWAAGMLASADPGFEGIQTVYIQNIAVTIVSSVIFAPVVEELLFRALMYRRMKCVFRGHTAIIVSALFFAVGHASVLQLVYGFIMGIVFAVLYDRRNTILAPVAMHMAANLITILIKL